MRIPSHTTVVAYLALFVAIGTGGAFAISISRDSIKSRHLANDVVKRQHVADNAIGAEQLGKLPGGRMEADGQHFENSGFDNVPVTFDSLDYGTPKDAFNLARGVFVVPIDGVYLITAQITWDKFPPGGGKTGRDARVVTLNDDGSSKAVLIGPHNFVQGDGNQVLNQNVRLKEGDVIQLNENVVDGPLNTTFASLEVIFQTP